jgi:hypothetical protein
VEFPSGWAVPERGDAVTLSGALPVASLQSILPRVRSATPFLSAAPPPAASRSFLGGMGGWLSRSRASVAPRLEASPPAKPPAPVDLSAYRRRAKELLDRMAAAGPGQDERLRELAVLAVRLRELLEDLRSAVGDHAEAKPLAGLAEALEKHTAAAAPGHDVLDGLWTQAGVVLAAFAGVKPGGGAVRRRWWA